MAKAFLAPFMFLLGDSLLILVMKFLEIMFDPPDPALSLQGAILLELGHVPYDKLVQSLGVDLAEVIGLISTKKQVLHVHRCDPRLSFHLNLHVRLPILSTVRFHYLK